MVSPAIFTALDDAFPASLSAKVKIDFLRGELLLSFEEASTYLAVYNVRDLALEMAAETLFGRREPLGRLPVSLPGLYGIGHSAYAE